MTFSEAVQGCFRKFIVFSGRASRAEFWFFALFVALIKLATRVADSIMSPRHSGDWIFSSIAYLVLLLPQISVQVRRLHDTNRSGWWILGFCVLILAAMYTYPHWLLAESTPLKLFTGMILLAAVISFFVLIVWFMIPGTPGPNRFGSDPLARDEMPAGDPAATG